jgi:hypothetical protein
LQRWKPREKGLERLSEIEERLRESGYGKHKKRASMGFTEEIKPFLLSNENN